MAWIYQGKEFTENMIGNSYGFVYCITNTLTRQKYIGRKYFHSKITKKPLKGRVNKRHFLKESDWKDYWSSSKIVHGQIEKYGKENFKREIISLHINKQETNYHELVLQIQLDVLNSVDENGNRIYLNENILSKFYPSKKEDITNKRLETRKLYETYQYKKII